VIPAAFRLISYFCRKKLSIRRNDRERFGCFASRARGKGQAALGGGTKSAKAVPPWGIRRACGDPKNNSNSYLTTRNSILPWQYTWEKEGLRNQGKDDETVPVIGHALHALIDLGIAAELGRPIIQVSELAAKEKLPIKSLEQIFTQLKASGFVVSKRGKDGGYSLARPMNTLSSAPSSD
jgi:hypothetical protein